MPVELIQIDTRKVLTRIVLLLLVVVATLWSYYAVRWYLGNTMAEYFSASGNTLHIAQVANNLSPNDPLTNWRLGQVSQKTLPLDQSAAALIEYEKAVSLSPSDYRMWMSLGVAREQAGDAVKAEAALRQSIALAPSYAYPHWYLGNLLLRSARYDEAFAELRTASDAYPEELRPQLFNLIWQVYGSDFDSLGKAVGSNAEARSQFALYLLKQQKFDEGIRMWNVLSEVEKKANKDIGDSIVSTLVAAVRFHDAAAVWNALSPNSSYQVEEGQVDDGSFEEIFTYGPEVVFGWQVKSAPQAQIGIDPDVSHGGKRSLRLQFLVRSQLEGIGVSQLLTVAQDSTYDFECFVRTDKLQTGGAPVVQILDANAGALLGESEVAPNGTNDWKRLAFTFKTTSKTEAVVLKITRASCGGEETTICPIFGSVWYDDFSFKRHN